MCCCQWSGENYLFKHVIRNSVRRRRDRQKQKTILFTCFASMGFTWIFGMIVLVPSSSSSNNTNYTHVAISLLFCIFNSLQGLFLLISVDLLTKRNGKSTTRPQQQQQQRHAKVISTSSSTDVRYSNQSKYTSKDSTATVFSIVLY